MRKIEASLRSGPSEIRIAPGLYQRLGTQLRRLRLSPPYLLVSQDRVLSSLGVPPLDGVDVFRIPSGERAKSLATVERLIDRMVAMKMSREATAIALGGGVVGDVTGFAASIYLRGIRVVQVPTTLLAQVDSSVGGKTGVNHRSGKNLIGTFYQPRLVVVDPECLRTLPRREYSSGLYEALKYGVIRDPGLFALFEDDLPRILARDPAMLEDLVYRCLRIKAEVVEADEREGDLRRILNFGHTIGHGIEAALGYRKLRHGEAVGYGMIGAARLARRLDRISGAAARRIERAVGSIGPLPLLPTLDPERVLEAMSHDKKVKAGSIHFVLPRRVGRVSVEAGIPRAMVREVVRSLL